MPRSDSITLSEWRKALEVEPVGAPKGWLTLQELSDKLGLSRSGVGHRISACRLPVEIRRFRVAAGQRVYPVPHYRLKTSKP